MSATPTIFLNTSRVSTLTALAGNMALVVGGLLLTKRLKDNLNNDQGIESDNIKDDSEAESDVDRIVNILVTLKYSNIYDKDLEHTRRMDIDNFINR